MLPHLHRHESHRSLNQLPDLPNQHLNHVKVWVIKIAEVLSASWEAQIAASEARIQAHLTFEDRKINNIQKVEQLHIDFQWEQELHLQQDCEATRQHELLMIDKQIELERLQHGFAPPVIDPSL